MHVGLDPLDDAGCDVRIQLQRQLQVRRLVSRKRHGIDPRVARRAVLRASAADGIGEAVEAEIGHAVGVEILADFLERVRRGDQFRPARRVDAVEARRDRRRAADAHVHLACARAPHHPNDLPARRPAHDRVVDEHDAPAFEDAAHRIELHPHAEVANRLLRLDERAADVVVPNESHPHRDARRLRVSDGGADAGVGNRDDHIGIDGRFTRERAAELRPHFVDALAEHVAVGP